MEATTSPAKEGSSQTILRFVLGIISIVVIHHSLLHAQECASTPVQVGYRTIDFEDSGMGSSPTEEKPESKLWWADNNWWGVLWDPDSHEYRIHKFDLANQCWLNVGPTVDNRARSSADVLWDESSQKVYMTSHAKESHSGNDRDVFILRYSYDPGNQRYTLDNGFPVAIHDTRVEALTLTKDSTGQLWVTWEQERNIYINRSVGSDTDWGTPFILPSQPDLVTHDDISAITKLGPDKIGVMWSDQRAEAIFFSVHEDSKSDTDWQTAEQALTDDNLGQVADDHINLALSCAGGGQTLVAVVKTGLAGDDSPLIYLLKRTPEGVWSRHVFGLGVQKHTRPIVLVNSETDSVYVLANGKTDPDKIYLKRTHLDNPNFVPGLGETFIHSNFDDEINDPTSTKQCINSQSGLLVLANDKLTQKYFHNYLSLSSGPPIVSSVNPQSGFVGSEVTISGSSLATTNEVSFNGTRASNFSIDSDRQLRALVPAGATTGPIRVSNATGTATSSMSFTVTTSSEGETVAFTPVHDSYIIDGKTNRNYNGTTLRAKHEAMTSYLKFDVSGLTAPVQNARLRLFVSEGSDDAGSVFRTSNNFQGSSLPWTEDELTAANAPEISGGALSSFGAASSDVTVEFDVTAAVTGNGTFSFALTNQSSDLIKYSSKEGDVSPELVVTTDSDGSASNPPVLSSFSPLNGPVGAGVTIIGSNFSGTTQVLFNGTSASFSFVSDSQLTATVPNGATTGPISVTNSDGTAFSGSDFTVEATQAGTITLNPIDDTFVWSARPDNNYGHTQELRVRQPSSEHVHTYLKFEVSGIAGSIQSAILRLRVTDASDDGGGIYSVSNNENGTSTPWSEDGLLWDNAPEITGSPLSSVGAVSVGQTVEFDVTAAMSGNGIYSFAIANESNDVCKYSSKDGAAPPELAIETGAGSARVSDSNQPAKLENDLIAEHAQETDKTLPEDITLFMNYPNPFNTETTIEYALPRRSQVRLFIYNLRGQEVRKLFHGNQEAGLKKVTWNGRNESGNEVGSGLYFLRLQVGREVLTRKITLQK